MTGSVPEYEPEADEGFHLCEAGRGHETTGRTRWCSEYQLWLCDDHWPTDAELREEGMMREAEHHFED